MILKKGQGVVFIVNLIYLLFALIVFLFRENYEFLGYIGVIVAALILILITNNKIKYPNFVLWGLTVWGMMHMAGGAFVLSNGDILYKLILFPINADMFRYDQLVHLIGFSIATLLMWVLIKPSLSKKLRWGSLGIVIVMAGLGVGALNEIIEFIATVVVPNTNVGGYTNTALDLVSDFVGALFALWYIKVKKGLI